jgi:hypothetical protein
MLRLRQINALTNDYLSLGILYSNLQDLPKQFVNPQPRFWDEINIDSININQIVDIDSNLFINVIASAAEVEAPIRDYAVESRDYLQACYPEMAKFMGGDTFNGKIKLGVWEKEERQHLPIFAKIYQQLTSEKLEPKANTVQGYESDEDFKQAAYYHVINRIATEWGATSIYLWLATHSTGELQQAILQPLQDEINHLAKFWGFACWAFDDNYPTRLSLVSRQLLALANHNKQERTQSNNILAGSSSIYTVELGFTFIQVIRKIQYWHYTLNRNYLERLFS